MKSEDKNKTILNLFRKKVFCFCAFKTKQNNSRKKKEKHRTSTYVSKKKKNLFWDRKKKEVKETKNKKTKNKTVSRVVWQIKKKMFLPFFFFFSIHICSNNFIRISSLIFQLQSFVVVRNDEEKRAEQSWAELNRTEQKKEQIFSKLNYRTLKQVWLQKKK